MRVESRAIDITATFAGGLTLTRHVSAGGSANGAVWHADGDGSGVRYSSETGVAALADGMETVTVELFPDSAPPASQLVRIDAELF